MSETQAPRRVDSRAMRPLRMAETGQPAPFRLGAPAYLVAFGGWIVAAALLLGSAGELSALAVSEALAARTSAQSDRITSN